MHKRSPNSNLNESDLLELALRLATYPGDSRTQHAQLLPGQLPDPTPLSSLASGHHRPLSSTSKNRRPGEDQVRPLRQGRTFRKNSLGRLVHGRRLTSKKRLVGGDSVALC